jgi:2-amino-4-hydroxy-6-hydroxymethyldihydropteridine diphosphokinase
MSDVLLSIGSNLGDRLANLADVVRRLDSYPNITVTAQSSLYRTVPVGPVAQDDFINGAVRITTNLAAEELMKACLAIEASMGRDRTHAVRWGPRVIDIDIILFDDLVTNSETLILPHPRFRERAFVLIPLVDIAPDWRFEGQSLATLASLIDQTGVERLSLDRL